MANPYADQARWVLYPSGFFGEINPGGEGYTWASGYNQYEFSPENPFMNNATIQMYRNPYNLNPSF